MSFLTNLEISPKPSTVFQNEPRDTASRDFRRFADPVRSLFNGIPSGQRPDARDWLVLQAKHIRKLERVFEDVRERMLLMRFNEKVFALEV